MQEIGLNEIAELNETGDDGGKRERQDIYLEKGRDQTKAGSVGDPHGRDGRDNGLGRWEILGREADQEVKKESQPGDQNAETTSPWADEHTDDWEAYRRQRLGDIQADENPIFDRPFSEEPELRHYPVEEIEDRRPLQEHEPASAVEELPYEETWGKDAADDLRNEEIRHRRLQVFAPPEGREPVISMDEDGERYWGNKPKKRWFTKFIDRVRGVFKGDVRHMIRRDAATKGSPHGKTGKPDIMREEDRRIGDAWNSVHETRAGRIRVHGEDNYQMNDEAEENMQSLVNDPNAKFDPVTGRLTYMTETEMPAMDSNSGVIKTSNETWGRQDPAAQYGVDTRPPEYREDMTVKKPEARGLGRAGMTNRFDRIK